MLIFEWLFQAALFTFEWLFQVVWAILAFVFRGIVEMFGETLLSEGLSFLFDRPAARCPKNVEPKQPVA